MRDVASLTRHLARPAIHIVKRAVPTRSHFGGIPDLPKDVPWPAWRRGRLAFLARIGLTELYLAHDVPWLPQSGALLFFYDIATEPWGFDPGDHGGAKVLFLPDVGRTDPGFTSNGDAAVALRYAGFSRIDSLPSGDHEEIRALGFSDAEAEAYENLRLAPFRRTPRHQISGYPTPIQGDGMELECQLASNGILAGSRSSRARALASGARDWRLLLQLDSDQDLGVMWGDAGTIYFWVREAEASAGRFENAWVILQCC